MKMNTNRSLEDENISAQRKTKNQQELERDQESDELSVESDLSNNLEDGEEQEEKKSSEITPPVIVERGDKIDKEDDEMAF